MCGDQLGTTRPARHRTTSALPRALYEVGEDRDNKVLILTGTGDRFMTQIDGQSLDDPTKPAAWDKTTAEGRRMAEGYLLGSALEGLAGADLAYQQG